jgi:hypothetical protein
MKYFVVFEYNEKAGAYCGTRFFCQYNSKEDFEESEKKSKATNSFPVADGLKTVEEAQALCFARKPTYRQQTAIAVQEATDPDGTVNDEYLQIQLRKADFMRELDLVE